MQSECLKEVQNWKEYIKNSTRKLWSARCYQRRNTKVFLSLILTESEEIASGNGIIK